MTINWWTMALQTINFLVLVWLLHRFLYKPVLAVIAKRKQLVEQAFVEAESAKQAANAEQQSLQQGQAALAQARQDLLKKTHAELDAERIRITATAQDDAAALLDAARAQSQTERAAALAETRAEVADLAVAMASTILQQLNAATPVVAQLSEEYLTQLTRRLDELPGQELDALRKGLEAGADALRVVTATALSEDQKQRWQRTLAERIGAAQRLEFLVEPQLIGGAELRFPHAVLSFAWSELLQQEKRALLENEVVQPTD